MLLQVLNFYYNGTLEDLQFYYHSGEHSVWNFIKFYFFWLKVRLWAYMQVHYKKR